MIFLLNEQNVCLSFTLASMQYDVVLTSVKYLSAEKCLYSKLGLEVEHTESILSVT